MKESYFLEKAKKDDKILNNIRKLVKQLLEDGFLIEEVKNKVLESKVYKIWNSKDRTIYVDFLDNTTYENLKNEYEEQIYFKQIDDLSKKYYNSITDNIEIKLNFKNKEKNIYFKKLGIHIDNEQLVFEIIIFSKKINLKYPMPMEVFYDIIGSSLMGAISTALFHYPEIWGVFSENTNETHKFIMTFLEKYQVEDITIDYE